MYGVHLTAAKKAITCILCFIFGWETKLFISLHDKRLLFFVLLYLIQ